MKKLIVITDPAMIPQEAATINQLFDAGLDVLHVRKPGIAAAAVTNLLASVAGEYHERIALHQHHELAGQFGMNRLHFMETARSNGVPVKQQGYCFSTSVHNPEVYQGLPHCFDYAFYGPVFDSISKPGYKAHTGTRNAPANSPVRLIALGGINEENCLLPLEMGYDGVAVLGAIWQSSNPVQTFKNIQRCITKDR
jgi:thiamine-phosphate pyrophosphorylase